MFSCLRISCHDINLLFRSSQHCITLSASTAYLNMFFPVSYDYWYTLWFQKNVMAGKKLVWVENGLKIGLFPNLLRQKARHPYPLY